MTPSESHIERELSPTQPTELPHGGGLGLGSSAERIMRESSGLLSSSSLPQEILASILGYLFGDKSSLQKCSLVSRNWLYPSRLHLFRSVRIKSAAGFQGFLEFLGRTGSISYMQRLFICGAEKDAEKEKFPDRSIFGQLYDREDPTELYPSQLSYLLHHLPALRHLHLNKFYLKQDPAKFGDDGAMQGALLQPRYSLSSLVFERCLIGAAEPLVGFLSPFQSVGKLEFYSHTR